MKLDDAVADIERRFELGPDGDCSLAANGEPFVTVVSGGRKQQGGRFPAWYNDEDGAAAAWHASVLAYAEGRGTKLYWRHRPEFERHKTKIHPLFTVYSRLLVSNT